MTETPASDEARWPSFIPDAAHVLNAEARYEDAVAASLDRTFDETALGRVEAAIADLRAARPTAVRLASAAIGGGS